MAEAETEVEGEAYAEDTALTKLFGGHAKSRIIAAVLSEADQDLNVTQIAELAGVTRKTVYEHIDDLVALGVIEHTRDVAGSKMYQVDRDDDIAEKIAELEWQLIDRVDEEGV